MKKTVSFVLCVVMILALAGCGKNDAGASHKNGTGSGVDDVLSNIVNSENATPTPTAAASDATPTGTPKPYVTSAPVDASTIDIDLTQMSSTLVYSQIYDIVSDPDKYLGKIIKMSGTMNMAYEESTNQYYFACFVQDASACCSQGIEFVLTDDYKFPDDYPEVGTDICVVGRFDTYEEGEYLYCTLRDAKFQ